MTDPLRIDSDAPNVCDACQERPALVTLGCVDYCAPCAPPWSDLYGTSDDRARALHPSAWPLDDLEISADDLLREHGIPVARPEPVEAWTAADRAWAIEHGYLQASA